MKKIAFPRRQVGFAAIWLVATGTLGWQLAGRKYAFESPATAVSLLVLLTCTIWLLRLLPNPIPSGQPEDRPASPWFIPVAGAVIIVLISAFAFLGRSLLYALPVIAIFVLLILNRLPSRREVFYALGLAIIASAAGLGAGWITYITPLHWSILQLLLVFPGLLAGWGLLRAAGLLEIGVGKSRFLTEGFAPSLRSFALGIVLAIPWAMGNIVMGGSQGETWVKAWWQPFTAIQPGISEEAWGRILLAPLLFVLLRHFRGRRVAFTTALVISAYWFAYLHTPGGVGALVSTLLIGTLYALPISYLCLYRDLETAMGFHFWIDFVKFAFAFFLCHAR